MAEITIGSRVAKSPYHADTVAAGATSYTIYNHTYMPTSYGDPLGEYERLTTGVSVWDVAGERQVEIVGPDALALTQYLCARNLDGLRPGRARYTPLCNHDGILINDPIAMRLDDDRFWLSIADGDVLLFCQAVAGERRADVRVFEPDVSPLAIQGPKAEALATDLFGAELVSGLGFFHHTPTSLDGIPLVLCRSGWSRQGGFELFLTDGSRGSDLWQAVTTAGAQYGIGPGSPHQMERLENGLLSFRSDTDDDTDPIEAGLGRWVDLDGDDFVGRDALIERHRDPRRRRSLVNVTLQGEVAKTDQPWPMTLDGQPCGTLRTAAWSPKLGATIGLALVPVPNAAPGTVFDVTVAGAPATVTVSDVPFGASL